MVDQGNISMDVMEEECGRYFASYGRCVEKFPRTWHIDCLQQKIKLNKCANSNPLVVEVKKKCSSEFDNYDACAHRNPDKLENCRKQFDIFDSCAEKVARALKSQNKQPSTTNSTTNTTEKVS